MYHLETPENDDVSNGESPLFMASFLGVERLNHHRYMLRSSWLLLYIGLSKLQKNTSMFAVPYFWQMASDPLTFFSDFLGGGGWEKTPTTPSRKVWFLHLIIPRLYRIIPEQ